MKKTELNTFWKGFRRYGTIAVIVIATIIAALSYFGGESSPDSGSENPETGEIEYYDK